MVGTSCVSDWGEPFGLSVGLSGANGSAATFMRSDGAPALSQAIAPTWTGNHIFTPASGSGPIINQLTSGIGLSVRAGSTYQANVYITGNGATDTTTGFALQQDSSNNAYVWNIANAVLYFGTDNKTRVTVAAAGNVTIAAPDSGVALTINGIAGQASLNLSTSSTYSRFPQNLTFASSGGDYPLLGYNLAATTVAGTYNYVATDYASCVQFASGGIQLKTAASGTSGNAITLATKLSIAQAGGVSIANTLGWNGASPPAQVTGFGTPTGPAVVANFSGTAATTANIQHTIAQILTVMISHGMIGA